MGDEEEGEIKMIDPTGDEKSGETEPESEKSEEVFERKIEVDPSAAAAEAEAAATTDQVEPSSVGPADAPLSYRPDKLLGESGATRSGSPSKANRSSRWCR